MKRLLPFIIAAGFLLFHQAFAQPWNEIRILHVDTQNFPTVHVKVRAFCSGQPSNNINPINVRIFENGVQRSMMNLSCPTQTVPVSVALALDRSGSVAGTSIYRIKTGAWRFVELFQSHSTGDDEGAIFSFGDDVTKHVGMTTNLNALFNAIDKIYPFGVTTMFDAVVEALHEVANNGTNPVKAVVVFSDGDDNNSFASLQDVIALANQLSIPIHAIGVSYEETQPGLENMRKLADSTGGKFIVVEHPDDIIPAFDAMVSIVSGGANDCDMQYLSNCPDGSWRELTVIAEACGLADTMHVRFRAPLDPNLPAFKVSFDSTFAYENGDLYLPVTVEAEGGGGMVDNIKFKVLERPPLQFREIITRGFLGESMQVLHSRVGDTLFVEAVGPVFISGPSTLLQIRYTTPPISRDTTFIYPVFFLEKRTQDCMQLKVRNTYLEILKRPALEIYCDDTLYVDWDEQTGDFFNDEVTVSVHVRNNGAFPVENTLIRLRVPDGMVLLSPSDSIMLPVNPLMPDITASVEFKLRVLPNAQARTYQLCVEVRPDSGVVTTCCHTVVVEQARTILEADCEMISRIEWSDSLNSFVPDRFPVTVHVTNRSELRAENISAWIHVPPGFVVDSLTPVNTFVNPARLGRNDTGSVTWWVRPLERPTSDLVRFCVKVAAGLDTAVCCQDVFITASPVRVLMRCADTRVMVYDDGTGMYDPDRFLIATTVVNVSNLVMSNTRGHIQLPPFLSVEAGDFLSKDFPNSAVIPPGDSATIKWVVRANGYPKLPADICVSVTAENFPGAQCCTPLDIEMVNAIPGLQCSLSGPDTVLYISNGYVPNPIVLNLTVRNTGNTPAKKLYAALLQGEDLSIDPSDQALKLITDSLAFGDSISTTFRVRILDRPVARYDTIRITTYAENGGAVVCWLPVYVEAVRGPILELACNGPDTLVFSDQLNRYQPDPFMIQLTARNIGTAQADSVVAEFLPPPDIILATGETAAKLLTPPSLGVGQYGDASWMLRAVPRDIARVDTIFVQVKSKGKTLQQTAPCAIPVYIPAARKPELELTCFLVQNAGEGDTVIVAAGIVNNGSAAAYDVTVRVQFPSKLQLDPSTQPLLQRVDVIQPGEALRLFPWRFTVQRGAKLDSVDVCFTAEANFVPPQTCCTSVLIPPADAAAFDYSCTLSPDTARVDAASGEYGGVLFRSTLSNPTSVALDSVRCTIVLPAGIILATGEREVKIVRNLLPGIPQSVEWRLTVVRDTSSVYRERSIRVDLVGAGAVERCSRTIILEPPPRLPADFIIACSAPDTIVYQRELNEYTPAPFLIRAAITNTGSTTLTNVRGTLTLAAELALESGEAVTKSLGVDLGPGQQATLAWNCRGIPQSGTVTAVSRIRVEADEANARSCDAVTVMLRPPTNDSLAADIACLAPDTIRYYGRSIGWRPSPFTFSVRLTNTGSLVLNGLRGTLLLPEGFTLEEGEQGIKQFPSDIIPGETVAVNWTVRVLSSGSVNPCFEALVTIPGLGTIACTQCVYVEPPFDNIQLSIPDDNVGMMGQTVSVPIDLLNQLALPMKDFTLTIGYDPQLVAIDEIDQIGTLTRAWPAPAISHPAADRVQLHFSGDTPLLTSGVLAFLRCRLLSLAGRDGSFGVFQSRLAFIPAELIFEAGIAAITIDGQIFTSGSCVVPLDATDALQLSNRPNPFNPLTVVSWSIPASLDGEDGTLLVLDLHGREVARLHEGTLRAGAHQTVFDASALPSGMYLYRLQAGNRSLTRKMMFAK
ncbi:MAG: VWA domain-containing protein [Bacteroidetes bacterium]|nr:VWA domain-containing protein [Bacteroidota bacterium]